jgi:thiosulfate/3-mercaptopyruvate sulfurtransferase
MNIPYTDIINGKSIKDEAELEKILGNLSVERPVVVFTTTGVKASMVWFVLSMMSYDAKLYSYKDWLESSKKIKKAAVINKSSS